MTAALGRPQRKAPLSSLLAVMACTVGTPVPIGHLSPALCPPLPALASPKTTVSHLEDAEGPETCSHSIHL